MSDLIDRQAAIDAMNAWDWQELYLPIHFKQLLDELPSAEKRGQWIPVTERLPEEGQRCLVCAGGAVGIDKYLGREKPYKWSIYCGDYDAWMPLPEPWREDEE